MSRPITYFQHSYYVESRAGTRTFSLRDVSQEEVDNAHISREGPKEEIQSSYGIFQPIGERILAER